MNVNDLEGVKTNAAVYLYWPLPDGTVTLKELAVREDQGSAVILEYIDEEEP